MHYFAILLSLCECLDLSKVQSSQFIRHVCTRRSEEAMEEHTVRFAFFQIGFEQADELHDAGLFSFRTPKSVN